MAGARARAGVRGPLAVFPGSGSVNAALDEPAADAFPEGYALCHEAEDLGEPLRQKMFGPGRRLSHRLIFRVTPAAIEVLAVRGFHQRDLTTRDF